MSIVTFIVSAVLMAIAERRYIDALAERTGSVPSMRDAGDAIQGSPRDLVPLGFATTRRYIRAFARRQDDAELEQRRLVALALIATTLAAFLWVVVD